MDRAKLLTALEQGDYESFHMREHACHLCLDDGCEILVQCDGGTVPEARMALLRHVLQNEEAYLDTARRRLRPLGIRLGGELRLYGIYAGQFSFGAHGLHLFDGFTVSLAQPSADGLSLDVYTVQFKADGWPLGASVWFV